jgi:prepilin-type N-terminal cleavage/methylation domain-containing protein
VRGARITSGFVGAIARAGPAGCVGSRIDDRGLRIERAMGPRRAGSSPAPDRPHLPTSPLPHAASPRPHRVPRALTLMELLVVVALVALLATGVAVQLQGTTESGRLRSAALQLEQTLRRARHRATTRHESVWLQLHLGTGRYRTVLQDESAARAVWQSLDGATIEGAVIGSDAGRGLHSEILTIRITPSGASLPWAVRLRAGSARRVIWTDGVTGRMQHRGLRMEDRGARRLRGVVAPDGPPRDTVPTSPPPHFPTGLP